MHTNSTTTTTTKPTQRPKILHVQDPDGPHVHCAADFPAEPVQWLWPNRIPIGSITLLAGDPGTGKSLFAIDLVARVSRALPFPDEPPTFAPSATTANTNRELRVYPNTGVAQKRDFVEVLCIPFPRLRSALRCDSRRLLGKRIPRI
jgi:hypothetical protein